MLSLFVIEVNTQQQVLCWLQLETIINIGTSPPKLKSTQPILQSTWFKGKALTLKTKSWEGKKKEERAVPPEHVCEI